MPVFYFSVANAKSSSSNRTGIGGAAYHLALLVAHNGKPVSCAECKSSVPKVTAFRTLIYTTGPQTEERQNGALGRHKPVRGVRCLRSSRILSWSGLYGDTPLTRHDGRQGGSHCCSMILRWLQKSKIPAFSSPLPRCHPSVAEAQLVWPSGNVPGD
jgi:hypothetical protein